MSVCCQPTANAQLSSDPTGTLPIRRDLIDDIQSRFRKLRGAVRSKVGYENDALHLMQSAPGATLSTNAEDDRDRFEFVTREGLISQFRRWLRARIREFLLGDIDPIDVSNGRHWTAPYIRSTYTKGWQQATGRLMQEGVSITAAEDVEAILQLPVPRQQLRKLYTRAFENLQGITDAIGREVRDTLTRGLAAGWNPRKMARRMTDEIDDIEATRARVLARTETIYSHNEAALDRYEQAGVGTVRHGEWTTAGDDRVCPICEALEGREFTIPEMRNGTFQFDAEGEDVPDHLAGTYPLHPPAHPNGRCTVLPVVGG